MKKIVCLIILVASSVAFAGEPSKEPILRIETGMHTAMIWRIGIDAQNQYLVTGSDDKTVRVWELSTGRLIKILRPPVGNGNEGKIYAVAISPDAETIACAGWTGYEWDWSHSIYLFDRESGNIMNRITGLPSVIAHLTYSKDGRFLVATLCGSDGIRIYRTSDFSLIAEDRDYGSDSYGADFDKHGRLVTASYDGFIRLYDKGFILIAKEKATGGNQPYSVSFHPNGSKIAVGFNDSTKVDILSAKDLSYLYSPDTGDVNNGDLSKVSFSADGRFLYAGGMYDDVNGKNPIRKWANSGKGSYIDLPAADNTIMHILSLKTGGIVYGAADPCFGIFNNNDIRTVFKSPFIADYRDNLEGFLISYDGSKIQFGYEVWGKSPAKFSVINRLLELDPGIDNSLKPPLTSGLNITDWKNTYAPRLNGNALKLEQYEISRCLAIAPDGNNFLLGTEWYLRFFDSYGQEKWNTAIPGVCWGVNISGNGKVAVAAFGDGTIRWYRLNDGKELLSLFPHKDKRHWVMWSPSGYYDASPGADNIIGWHKNNGKDRAADFFPISKFRSTYYRPDVIAKILETVDESEAVRLANEEAGRRMQEASIEKMLPPVVRIISPRDNSEVSRTEITVRFTVRSPSGEPVTGIKALVQGRPVATERGIKIVAEDEHTREIKVTIPEQDCEISIIAENRYSTSEPATVRIRWRGKTEEFVIKPKLYILSIGVSRYENKALKLGFASKDAKDFALALLGQKGLLYRDVITKVLTDETATKDEILDGFDWIRKETTSKDVAMVFLAGHGVNDQSGIYYFLPVNANPEKLMRTGVAFSDIKNTIASLAGKTLFFVDTCHSGNVMGTRRGVADITAVINELASAENGAVVFASSSGNQYSLEDAAWGNGAFTKALIEGIKGKADYTGKGKITVNMLDLYISERVKELTKGRQTPTTTKPQTVPDFPVVVKK